MDRKIYKTCEKCGGSGVCQPCKGSGKSGFFLTMPGKDAKPCRWCKGSAHCDMCGGTGKVVKFAPHICVQHSRSAPVSITLAAFSGALWRFIPIPDEVLSLADDDLLAWVSTRVREHYQQENGECPLYGDITAYRLVQAPGVSVRLDVGSRYVETVRKEPAPATATFGVGNKIVEVQKDGTWKIDATEKEPE